MLRRSWLLLSILWAGVFLWNGSTKESGIGEGDIIIATIPYVAGWLSGRAFRFIVTGSPMRQGGQGARR